MGIAALCFSPCAKASSETRTSSERTPSLRNLLLRLLDCLRECLWLLCSLLNGKWCRHLPNTHGTENQNTFGSILKKAIVSACSPKKSSGVDTRGKKRDVVLITTQRLLHHIMNIYIYIISPYCLDIQMSDKPPSLRMPLPYLQLAQWQVVQAPPKYSLHMNSEIRACLKHKPPYFPLHILLAITFPAKPYLHG